MCDNANISVCFLVVRNTMNLTMTKTGEGEFSRYIAELA
jgi:hypothetical protein